MGLHAAAALFHHFVRHHDVLRRMLAAVADWAVLDRHVPCLRARPPFARCAGSIPRLVRPKYGYPPDKQEQATKTVLEQAELLSDRWSVGSRNCESFRAAPEVRVTVRDSVVASDRFQTIVDGDVRGRLCKASPRQSLASSRCRGGLAYLPLGNHGDQ